jgi:hypothetical protein
MARGRLFPLRGKGLDGFSTILFAFFAGIKQPAKNAKPAKPSQHFAVFAAFAGEKKHPVKNA